MLAVGLKSEIKIYEDFQNFHLLNSDDCDDFDELTVLGSTTDRENIYNVFFSPNGKYLVSMSHICKIYEYSNGFSIINTERAIIATTLCFTPDSNKLITGYIDIEIWDCNDKFKPLMSLDGERPPVSPNGYRRF